MFILNNRLGIDENEMENLNNHRSSSTCSLLFGKVIKNAPAKGNFGTQVIVEDLFKKLPVRRKFLNTDRAEGLAIKKLIKKMALAYPTITFRFIEDKKEKLFLLFYIFRY